MLEAQANPTGETCIYTYTKLSPVILVETEFRGGERAVDGFVSMAGSKRRGCRRCGGIIVADRVSLSLFAAEPVPGRAFPGRVQQSFSPSNGPHGRQPPIGRPQRQFEPSESTIRF